MQSVARSCVMACALGFVSEDGRRPAGGNVALGRIAQEPAQRHRKDQENDAERGEQLGQDRLERFGILECCFAIGSDVDEFDPGREVIVEQGRKKLGHRQCAKAKAHDHQSGGQAFLVRKPFGHGGHRGDVTEAQPAAADHAVADEQHERRFHRQSQSSEQITQSKQDAAGHGQLGRADTGQFGTAPGGSDAEEADRQREGPGGHAVGPAERVAERLLKIGPRVGGAQANLQGDTQQANDPAIGSVFRGAIGVSH